ncbi:MAG: Ger(x)C family spore germination protein [Vallitalea sp.]|jgi:spore germination protein KC|nr:Ger(x)C family spore germination protein [Vallitalea sp.]
MWKKILCLLMSVPIILTTGCWDSRDINEKCIVISLGVDYVDEMVEFSGEIVKLTKAKGTEGSSEATGVYTLLSYGKTFEEARVNYNSNNPFPTFLGATRVVVFGEDYAKLGIESYLNRVDSLYDYRKTLLPCISREATKDIFEMDTQKDLAVGFLIDDILTHLKEEGQAICPNIGNLLSVIAFGSEGYLIPYIGNELNDIKYLGLCVFKDSKLVDIINIEDTKAILYVVGNNTKFIELIPNPINNKNKYSFRVTIDKRKIKTDYENDTPIINISLNLDAELRYQYYIDPITDDMIKQFEDDISKKVTDEIFNMIKRAQKDFTCDIFSFGEIFKSQHLNQYNKINWEDAFQTAIVNIDVKTTVVNQNLKSAKEKE